MIDLIALMRKWTRENRPERATDDSFILNLAVEHVQHDVLNALMHSRLASFVVFQGGTALRMAYGNERFSEDLDFAISSSKLEDLRDTNPVDLVEDFSNLLRRELPGRYGWEPDLLKVKPPEDPYTIHGKKDGIAVNTWQISVPVTIEKRGPRMRRIKIEIAVVPAHTQEPRLVRSPTAGIPQLPQNAKLVPVETMDEIIADKVIALGARNALKFRDVWDISSFLAADQDKVRELISAKVEDYGLGEVSDFLARLDNRLNEVDQSPSIPRFIAEMQRFSTGDAVDEPIAKWRLNECASRVRYLVADLRHPVDLSP